MAAMASPFFHSNTSSRVWHERPPLVFPLCTLKSSLPADQFERESTRSRLRRRLFLAHASPLKGSISEPQQNVDDQKLNLDQNEPLMSTQSSEDPQTEVITGESTTDVIRHVNEEAKERIDQSETATDEPNSRQERETSGNGDGGDLISGDTALKGTIVAGLLLVGVVGGFGAVSYLYREQINDFLLEFSDFIEGYGAAGYALFVAVYAGLEILAIPAIPLTMSAGLLFGTLTGTIIVSISGTIAATAAFLIARYLARDRILKLAEGNKKFLAIDKAIGENGFRVVALLRLSPLLPFSIGNYLYGLTSVKLVPYVLGSWLGMLPGTWAYVSAGAVGRAIIQSEAEGVLSGGPEQAWTLGLGLVVTVFAATYVTRLAKDAVKDIDE